MNHTPLLRSARLLTALLTISTSLAQAFEPILASRGDQGITTGVTATVPSRRSLSADGRYALVETSAVNMMPSLADRNAASDIFLIDTVTDEVIPVSTRLGDPARTATGPSSGASMSPDGKWVVFNSDAADIVPGVIDVNGATDVFLFNRVTREVQLVSRATATTTSNGASSHRLFSADGRFVLFLSFSTNLTNHSDSNNLEDLYLFDSDNGTMTLISAAAGPTLQSGNGGVVFVSMSTDGRYVAFDSTSTNLVAGHTDTNNASDVFYYSHPDQTLQLLSRSELSPTSAANLRSANPMIAPDGSSVLFSSQATDLIFSLTDNNGASDVFRWRQSGNSLELVSGANGGTTATSNLASLPALACSDSRWSLFASEASNLVPGQIDSLADYDYFLRDHLTQSTRLVTHVNGLPTTTVTDGASFGGSSADCRYVLFSTVATDVVAGVTDTNFAQDLFLFDRQADASLLVSSRADNAQGTSVDTTATVGYSVSADGNWVLYRSTGSDLASGPDFNHNSDVFLRNMSNGSLRPLSRATRPVANGANGSARFYGMSRDGNWLLYGTSATNVIGANDPSDFRDFYLFGADDQTTTLVSRRFGQRNQAVDGSGLAALSGTGRYAAFSSMSNEVLPGISDGNESTDIYLFDRELETTVLVSRQNGVSVATANDVSIPKFVSDSGAVLFASEATDLVAGQLDSANSLDLFLYQPGTGHNLLVSHAAGQPNAALSADVTALDFSADGRFVLFTSSASTIAPGISDNNNAADLFLFDATDQSISMISRAFGQATSASGATDFGRLSTDGEWIVMTSEATNLLAGTSGPNLFSNVYLQRRSTGERWLVSHANTGPLVRSDGSSLDGFVSGDGEYVAFQSSSRDLLTGINHSDSNLDVFLFERSTGTITLVTRAWLSSLTTPANNHSRPFGISNDGQKVGIASYATNMVAPGVRNGYTDTFLFDAQSQSISLVSRHAGLSSSDEAQYEQAFPYALSADGGSMAVLGISPQLCANCNVSNVFDNLYLYRELGPLLSDGFE